jgi:hypothetical protein
MRVAWGQVKARMDIYIDAVETYNSQQPRDKKKFELAKKFHGELPGLQKEALAKIAAARTAYSDFRTQHWGMEEKVKGYKEMCKAMQDEMDEYEKYMKNDVPGWLNAGKDIFK